MKNANKIPGISGKPFPVVAIGASSGGLEAIELLLKNLPPDTGMAFFYIQHLDPTHPSMLTTILSRVTRMPVTEAENQMKIQADHFYIIPPNKEMDLVDGVVRVLPRPGKPYQHMPINIFFSSLAEKYKEQAVGIVLSGAASDGALGLKAIKLAGGLTFAQDNTAKFPSMPTHAVAQGAVGLVLSPADIASELVKLSKKKEFYYSKLEKIDESVIDDRDEHLMRVLQLLFRSTGVDFSQYKMNTIKRRILRRMMLYKLETVNEYAQYMRQNTNEVNLLYQDLLINVTSFFRDPETIEYLKKNLLPKILKNKGPTDPIRIWVPACSTGQEAYTIAMTVVEVLGKKAADVPIQLFATDLSESSINTARLGIYTKDEVSEIPPAKLERFFAKIDGRYRIVKSIRDLCVFATHNIAKDPPFSRLDLVSCCNLLIYIDQLLQKKIIATFHYSLNNHGFLIIGKSESVGSYTNLFNQLDKKIKIYSKKKEAAARSFFEMTARPESARSIMSNRKETMPKIKTGELDLEKTADLILLKKFIPASVIVNHDLDILQFRGSTGIFLEPSPGKSSLNLMKMAKPGLGFELRNLTHKARRSGSPVKKSGLEITHDGKSRKVTIEAIPLSSDGEDDYYLIIFEEMMQATQSPSKGAGKDKRAKQLEEELSSLREDMRSIVEEQEASNEELQSANEEVVSSNEELQSINEELETSKEELESSNEELITINQELVIRNDQLSDAYEYSTKILNIIRESVLVLSKDLYVKSANQAFYKTFKVSETETLGKKVYELGDRQWDIPKLRDLLETVIPQNHAIEGFEVTHVFPVIGEKIMRLNGLKLTQTNEDSILLSIEDITEFKQGEKILEEREEWFHNMADNAPVMIWVTGPDKLISFYNKAWLDYRGVTMEQVISRNWTEGVHPADVAFCNKTYDECFAQRKPFTIHHRLKKHDGQYCRVLNKARPAFSIDGDFTGFVGSCIELPVEELSTWSGN